MFTFIEHPTFTKQIESLFSDEEYRRLQTDLAANPESGDVIPGLGGLRKVRWGAKGKGKRGGARIIYLLIPEPRAHLLVLHLYQRRYCRHEPGAKEAISQSS